MKCLVETETFLSPLYFGTISFNKQRNYSLTSLKAFS